MIQKNTDQDITIWEALRIAWDILITVLVLTTCFALGGIYLDKALGTGYVFTVIGFLLLVFIGHRVLIKKAKRVQKRMQDSEHPTQQ